MTIDCGNSDIVMTMGNAGNIRKILLAGPDSRGRSILPAAAWIARKLLFSRIPQR
jgi:hypothetical protein